MASTTVAKDWVDYASAFTPIIVALFVAYIAYRQWRIARQKLRLDLYNKRFSIFETTLRFYQELLSGAELDQLHVDALHRQFITAMIESKFLFASTSGISEMMRDFNKSAFVIKGSRDVMKTTGIPPELLADTSDRLHKEQQGLPAKIEALQIAMTPYLSFRGLVD